MIMKRFLPSFSQVTRLAGAWLLSCVLLPSAWAFPPAPHHLLYGVVKDEFGTPLLENTATVILESPSGVRLSSKVIPALREGANYELEIPMDSGITRDLYQRQALLTSAPFKMYVVIGSVTNVPVQMSGDYAKLGKAGQSTRVDLTLGEDENHDGIPDDWETAFLASIGSPLTLSDLTPGIDLAHNGRTLEQEYLLGGAPFGADGDFAVEWSGFHNGTPVLSFSTMTGRSYTLLGTADLKQWTVIPFHVPAEGSAGAVHSFFWARSIGDVEVEPILSETGTKPQFFKVMVQ